MSGGLGRREFLKLMGLLPAMEVRWPWREGGQTGQPNVVILVFDTLSAQHVTLHGYGRETTPNLARFAERATVYHNCYSAGNFTTPGTASLLTGTYPWTHRALHLHGVVQEAYRERSLFHLFPEETYKIAYTHNPWVGILLDQFRAGLSEIKPTEDLYLDYGAALERLFLTDVQGVQWSEKLILQGFPLSSSLFLSSLYRSLRSRSGQRLMAAYGDRYPRGVPNHEDVRFFLLEHATNWILRQLLELPRPFLAYIHLLPPHEPYKPSSEFIGLFEDERQPPQKPRRYFPWVHSEAELNRFRLEYDEYLAYTDAELGSMLDFMDRQGILDDTLLVFTSDHGQLFERGIHGHVTETVYEGVIRVPLLISKPGQATGEEFHDYVSLVDVLPTLLHSVGRAAPAWCEGQILPGFESGLKNSDRAVFVLEAKSNPKRGAIKRGTLALLREDLKLIHYFGYGRFEDAIEAYDLRDDREELSDLSSSNDSSLDGLVTMMKEKLEEINAPFQ